MFPFLPWLFSLSINTENLSSSPFNVNNGKAAREYSTHANKEEKFVKNNGSTPANP